MGSPEDTTINSHRYQEFQKLLKELSQDITSLDIDSLVKKLTQTVCETFKVDVCDVRLLENGVWQSVGVSGIEPDRLREATTGTARGRSRWVIENRRVLSIADLSQQSDLPAGALLSRIGFRGYLGVPLFSRGGTVLGVLRALTYQPREFSDGDIDLLCQLTNGAAVALENASLLKELKGKTEELESANRRLNRLLREQSALREIFTQINLLDSGHLLHQLTEQALALLGVDYVLIRLVGKDKILRTVALAGKGAERFEGQLMQGGRTRSTWVMENRRPLAIKNISEDQVFGPSPHMREMGVKGFLAVPLISRQLTAMGVLQGRTLTEKEFTQEEIALAQQLAAGAAIAIENATLFEEVQKKSQELEEAFNTKSDFLNTMAHELRTPMNVIIGTYQLFADGFYGELSQENKKGLEPIRRNSIELLNLINGVLDLARLETKRVPLQIEEFRLKEIIEDLVTSFTPLLNEKGLALKLRIEDPQLTIKSDSAKIKEILQNLLANAIKYTDTGEIEIRARPLPFSATERGHLSFCVRDTGIGIKETDVPHIFEAFYMADGVNRKKYPGSGLGLSIVRRLVELLQGDIQVQSQWGRGSSFTVRLPLNVLDEG